MSIVSTEIRYERNVERILLGFCAAFLCAKAILAGRININWDEFLFLSHVHELARGELHYGFQTTYTRLFLWLTAVGREEITQIFAARMVMIVLLGATAALIWRLAARFTPRHIAPFAPLCYLAASFVSHHGASFRADSLLAPVTLGVLLLFTARPSRPRNDCLAGVCFGLAIAVSIKAVLLAPVVIALALLDRADASPALRLAGLRAARRLTRFGACAAGAASLVLLAHRLYLPAVPTRGAREYASDVFSKTLLETNLFPQLGSFLVTVRTDWPVWSVIAGGMIAAIARRKFAPLAFILSSLPIVFYRNAFPYYYVVMLAPASVLAAIALDAVQSVNGPAARQAATPGVIAIVALSGAVNFASLSANQQAAQREVIEAVHAVFPEPVPYIDHSGMVATFPKANFFMSSWGIENYLERGKGFVSEAIERHRPPLLLVNRPVLHPGHPHFSLLRQEDQTTLMQSYVPYWGPIWIAGTQVTVPADGSVVASVPFPGRYRLESSNTVTIEGEAKADGEILDFANESTSIRVESGNSQTFRARFVWAGAMHPPLASPPTDPLYVGL